MLRRLATTLMTGMIQGYRYLISPLLGPRCRFWPTCSSYALEAIKLHGPWRGGWLTLKRLSKCHPLHPGGVDPVPEPQHRCGCAARETSRDGAIHDTPVHDTHDGTRDGSCQRTADATSASEHDKDRDSR